METPKPKPFKPSSSKDADQQVSKPSPKRPYTLKPHLTDRPFKNNESLQKLQAEMQKREGRRPNNPKQQRQR